MSSNIIGFGLAEKLQKKKNIPLLGPPRVKEGSFLILTYQGLAPSKMVQYVERLDFFDFPPDRVMPHKIGKVAWRRHCALRPRHHGVELGIG